MRRITALLFFFFAVALPAILHAQTTNDVCLGCHDTVDQAKFNASVHSPLQCTNCHSDVTGVPHDSKPKAVDCSSCHTDQVAAWQSSLHAKAAKSGVARGAKCADCHGAAHEILPSSDINSRTNRASIPKTCSGCHARKFVMEKAGLSTQSAISYKESVHGQASANGNAKAAVCTDCHDSHAVLPANDPISGIFKFNVARTCGKCHASIATEYSRSVHGKALARGSSSAPVCTDCHGIHTIARSSDLIAGPRGSCARCHDGVRLTKEFAVPGDRVSTYAHSYHGLARQVGSTVAADCASCHGAHDVLPSADSRSAVNRANLTKTCGKCHDGAKEKFAMGTIHIGNGGGPGSDPPTRAVGWIRLIYIVLIALTIGFMAVHNAIIWFRKALLARRAAHRTVVRMNLNQRIQHAVLVISFTVLVISGFALAWPSSPFAWLFGVSEQLRRVVHRSAAVVMIAVGVYHLLYMTFTREGREGLRDLWWRWKDAGDLKNVLRYYLGFSSNKPEFGRFTYAEKAEYWAGLWGTLVMALTGLVIWYAVTVATWVPRWWIDIATTIHFYEAILATLAILVWHLYGVIFDPDTYPMNWAWFDGRMTEHQFHEEHGLVGKEQIPHANAEAKPKKLIGKEIQEGA